MKTREQVDLALIDDNPWQPRHAIDQEAVQDLADSIRQIGLLQEPLGRRTQDGRVQLAFGHSRVAACRLLWQKEGADRSQIVMGVDDLTDEKMAVFALAENVKRKQLTQIEVVRAHKRAIDETSLTIQALADQLGIDRSTLSNHLRVLELPDVVLRHVESGDLGLTVAREFLALQNGDHAHVQDMERVIDQIADTWGRNGAPDWSRRHVRQVISERVSWNDTDFRPLGPRPKQFVAGASREASFDVDMFASERPAKLHTIPAENNPKYAGSVSLDDKYEASRVWTCDTKTWRTWQTRATREANAEADEAGVPRAPTNKKTPSRDDQLTQLLAKDSVWKKIIVYRETPGPDRPVTDEERVALGTRATLQDVPYRLPFWKILQRGRPDDTYEWSRESGGHVEPFFPDLKECQACTIGAAYGKSSGGYPLDKATLCCFNRDHYQEKLEAGKAEYMVKLEANKKGVYRKDRETIERLVRELQPVSENARQVLAASLLAATETLEWEHPFGTYEESFSYESGAAVKVRELLGVEVLNDGRRPNVYLEPGAMEALEKVASEDLRELIAALMTYHLRRAGKLDAVSLKEGE